MNIEDEVRKEAEAIIGDIEKKLVLGDFKHNRCLGEEFAENAKTDDATRWLNEWGEQLATSAPSPITLSDTVEGLSQILPEKEIDTIISVLEKRLGKEWASVKGHVVDINISTRAVSADASKRSSAISFSFPADAKSPRPGVGDYIATDWLGKRRYWGQEVSFYCAMVIDINPDTGAFKTNYDDCWYMFENFGAPRKSEGEEGEYWVYPAIPLDATPTEVFHLKKLHSSK